MPLFSTADLTRFYNQGENEISTDIPFLVDRYTFATTSGVGTYTVPDYILSIRRVTWLGKKLEPLTARDQREVFQAATQSGTPYFYIFNNVGQNKLKLFPSPPTVGAVSGNLWGNNLKNGLVIEFYRATDNSTFVIPSWIKRRLLKAYVAKRSYAIDGAGSNLKLVDYYTNKWDYQKTLFRELLNDLYSTPRKLVVNSLGNTNHFPGEPILPVDLFGISVDEGQ